MQAREFDVVVWGASGFTGRLVAEHLLTRYGADGELRWALGGRNAARLEAVRSELGAAAAGLPILTANIDDAASLAALVARTRVICTTVGPYALYGSGLVAACAASGTHYCDLTGEVQWMRRMIDAHHETARQSGARIVHTCGFDSIPSDLGVFDLQRAFVERFGRPAERVAFRGLEFRGGFSGGTIASMLNMLNEADHDASIYPLLADPYGLNPAGERHGLDGPEPALPAFDNERRAWLTPFVMASINTKVVRRSNALAGYPYGHDFRYDEATVMPHGLWGFPAALAMSVASAAGMAAMRVPSVRRFVGKRLPQPGEGPSAAVRESGFYLLELTASTRVSAAQRLTLRIRGDRDPGYGSTARMLGESAVCLAQDALDSAGGVLTPATAMGGALVRRLTERAGITFEY